jgi:hypothetical protein
MREVLEFRLVLLALGFSQFFIISLVFMDGRAFMPAWYINYFYQTTFSHLNK